MFLQDFTGETLTVYITILGIYKKPRPKTISFSLESLYFCKSKLFSVTAMTEDKFVFFFLNNPRH